MSDLDTRLRRYMRTASEEVEPVTADEVFARAGSRRGGAPPAVRMALATAAVVAVALLAAGIGGLLDRPDNLVITTPDEDGWVTYRSQVHRFEISYPAGWNRAEERLTPRLTAPVEILTLTTGPPLVGSECGPVPDRAMSDLDADGTLVTIQAAGPDRFTGEQFPAKPDRFEVDDGVRVTTEACAPEGYWHRRFDFTHGGRAFYAYVTVGPSADRDLALRVLDTFDVIDVEAEGPVTVPDVEGMTLEETAQVLTELGLDVAVAGGHAYGDPDDAWSDPDEPGAVVVSQTPHAGVEVAHGAVVGVRTAHREPSGEDVEELEQPVTEGNCPRFVDGTSQRHGDGPVVRGERFLQRECVVEEERLVQVVLALPDPVVEPTGTNHVDVEVAEVFFGKGVFKRAFASFDDRGVGGCRQRCDQCEGEYERETASHGVLLSSSRPLGDLWRHRDSPRRPRMLAISHRTTRRPPIR
jgi:hypothetical protein